MKEAKIDSMYLRNTCNKKWCSRTEFRTNFPLAMLKILNINKFIGLFYQHTKCHGPTLTITSYAYS
jgi:hypothetical protein